MRCRGVLSVIVKTPEMHIPPWYWFSYVILHMMHTCGMCKVELRRSTA